MQVRNEIVVMKLHEAFDAGQLRFGAALQALADPQGYWQLKQVATDEWQREAGN